MGLSEEIVWLDFSDLWIPGENEKTWGAGTFGVEKADEVGTNRSVGTNFNLKDANIRGWHEEQAGGIGPDFWGPRLKLADGGYGITDTDLDGCREKVIEDRGGSQEAQDPREHREHEKADHHPGERPGEGVDPVAVPELDTDESLMDATRVRRVSMAYCDRILGYLARQGLLEPEGDRAL